MSLPVFEYNPDQSVANHIAHTHSAFEEHGFVIFKNVLSQATLDQLEEALTPHFEQDVLGRNDFEGLKSNRIYALMAKGASFAELAIHPLALGYAEHELGASCLLSAMLAIRLQPGESAQPWHTDDGHIEIPFPRPAYGVSAFWALDETTEDNGATEVLPGSHRWSTPYSELPGALDDEVLHRKSDTDPDIDPGAHPLAVKATLAKGSLMLAKGTLWHRGGANHSSQSRTVITPQYCSGWARQLENQLLAVPREVAQSLPARAQELLGYSIHPPFMGYVNGVHPNKQLT